jgi:predicted nucleotidyltransferase
LATDDLLREGLEEIRRSAAKHVARKVRVFGSAARGEAGEAADKQAVAAELRVFGSAARGEASDESGVAGALPTLPNPDLFAFMYVREATVLSIRIEGTQSSLQNLLAAEARLHDPDAPADVSEVVDLSTPF